MLARLLRLAHPSLLIALAACALLAGGFAVYEALSLHAQLTGLQAILSQQIKLNDSTQAKLAAATPDHHELTGLTTAAAALHGTLVAGVKITVPARDTLIIHDTLVTVIGSDSARTASFRDSTFAGVLSGTVIAPRTGALGLTYSLSRPSFTPSVGFVRVGSGSTSRVVSVVTWQGESYTLDAPYFNDAPSRFTKSAFIDYSLTQHTAIGGLAAELRLVGAIRATARIGVGGGGSVESTVGVTRSF